MTGDAEVTELLPACRRSGQEPPIPIIGSFGYRNGMSSQHNS